MACSEDNNLVVVPSLLQTLVGMRPDVDSSLDHFTAILDFDRQIKGAREILYAVNESLIKIEDQQLLMLGFGQPDHRKRQDTGLFQDLDVLETLQRLSKMSLVQI